MKIQLLILESQSDKNKLASHYGDDIWVDFILEGDDVNEESDKFDPKSGALQFESFRFADLHIQFRPCRWRAYMSQGDPVELQV